MKDTLSLGRLKTLAVVELRRELDKRGLEKSGLKADLLKRLEKSILGSKAQNNDTKDDVGSSAEGKEEIKVNGDDKLHDAEPITEAKPSDQQAPTSADDQLAESDNKPADSTSLESKMETSTKSAAARESAEVKMPESDSTKKQADSTTCDVQASESYQVESDYVECDDVQSDGERDVSTGVNELPYDEQADAEDAASNVIVVDDTQDEEMPEEDPSISIEVRDEHQGEFLENTDKDNGTTSESSESEKNEKSSEGKNNKDKATDGDEDDDDDEVIEVTVPKPKSDVVVIDDDNDEPSGENTSKDAASGNTSSALAEKKENSDKSKKQTHTKEKAKKTSDAHVKENKENKSSESSRKSSRSYRSHKSTSKDAKTEESKQRDTKDEKKKDLSRSLWISGLSSITKAVDLKELFSHHGKVFGAKVVTSAKTPGSQCFGFITMSSTAESLACIEKLNKTLLHEKTIEVEKAKIDPTPSKRPPSKSGDRKDDDKSRSSHHTPSSRSSRHDDHSRHRSHDERKRESEKKHGEKTTERSDSKSKTTTKPSKESTKDVKSTKAIEVKSRSVSKDGDVVVIEDKSKKEETKTPQTEDDGKGKDGENQNAETTDDKQENIKTVDQLRKEKNEKILQDRKEREERRKKDRERELQLREERRLEREKREKESKERARKEADRIRKEREKHRELEKERVRVSIKEKEHYLKERREREERERKEREQIEKEREQIEKEVVERERAERDRRERERAEEERVKRERQERERAEREKQRQQRLEKERLEKERIERERRAVPVDRGLGIKRPSVPNDDRREYHPDQKKRSMNNSNARKDSYHQSSGGRNDTAPAPYGTEQSRSRVNDRRGDTSPYKLDNRSVKGDVRELRYSRDVPRPSARYDPRSSTREHDSGNERLGYNQQPSDIRRVVPRDTKGDVYNRDRSPPRASDVVSKYRDGGRNSGASNAPKTLSDVLGRAGLTGILGSRAEEKPASWRNDVASSRSGERSYSSANQDSRGITSRSQDTNVGDYREQQRDTRVDARDDRSDGYVEDYRLNQRADERRGEPTRYNDTYRHEDRQVQYTSNLNDARDDRRDIRGDDRGAPNAAAMNNIPNERNFNADNMQNNQLSMTDRRGLHPLARDIGNVVPAALTQPRVLTDMFGRPIQVLPARSALQAGYSTSAQGLGLQNVGHTGIQLNRNGQLEYTRMQTPQTSVGLNRRF